MNALPLRPLMLANLVCSMAMMAFVSLIGPIVRTLGLAEWQAGAAVTVAGVVWMLVARHWGTASDRLGRRPILLVGIAGFSAAYWVLCLFIDFALHAALAPTVVFIALMLGRSAAGLFFAALPVAANALIAEHTPPERRGGVIGLFGAAGGAGLVLGPAIAAVLSQRGLGTPLYVTATLPLIALMLLVLHLPKETAVRQSALASTLKLSDRRLRLPLLVAFAAMFCVSIAQITVGFFALDRLRLGAAAAARASGIALTGVGFALILSQGLVRKIAWSPQRLIGVGALIAAAGFAIAALATTAPVLWLGYFVCAAGMGWVFPSFQALAANRVAAHEQGAAAGSVSAAQAFGVVLGPLTGTLLYGWQASLPYALSAAVLLVIAAVAVAATDDRGEGSANDSVSDRAAAAPETSAPA